MNRVGFLLFFLIVRSTFCVDLEKIVSDHPLGDIFCTALVQQHPPNPKEESLDAAWIQLEKHLENGQLYSSLLSGEQLEAELLKIKTSSIFKQCLSENKNELEYGEFILMGRKIIDETLQAYQKKSEPHLVSASFQLGGTGTLPFDFNLTLSSNSNNGEPSGDILIIHQRKKKYNAMWQAFISGLKGKTKGLRF